MMSSLVTFGLYVAKYPSLTGPYKAKSMFLSLVPLAAGVEGETERAAKHRWK